MFFKNKLLIIISVLICVIVFGLVFDVYRVSRARKEVLDAAHEVTKVSAAFVPYYLFRVKEEADKTAKKYGAFLKPESIKFDHNDHYLEFKMWKKVTMYMSRLVGKSNVEVVGQSILVVQIKGAGTLNSIDRGELFGGIDVDASFPFQQRILFGFTPYDESQDIRMDQIPFIRFEAKKKQVVAGDEVEIIPEVDTGALKIEINDLISKDVESTIELYRESSPRIVVIALLNRVKQDLKSPERRVSGFGAFFLEKFENNQVQGYFIQHYVSGEIDSNAPVPRNDYGLWRKGRATPSIIQ